MQDSQKDGDNGGNNGPQQWRPQLWPGTLVVGSRHQRQRLRGRLLWEVQFRDCDPQPGRRGCWGRGQRQNAPFHIGPRQCRCPGDLGRTCVYAVGVPRSVARISRALGCGRAVEVAFDVRDAKEEVGVSGERHGRERASPAATY